jgi:hypothetical protein
MRGEVGFWARTTNDDKLREYHLQGHYQPRCHD